MKYKSIISRALSFASRALDTDMQLSIPRTFTRQLSSLSRSHATTLPTNVRPMPYRLSWMVRAVASAAEPALKEPVLDNAMFCYQCEQTKGGTGCTKVGVCGKTPEVNYLQDLLTYSLKNLSCWSVYAKNKGVPVSPEVASFLHAASFSTLTNVNFDSQRFRDYVTTCHALRDGIEASLKAAGITEAPPADANLPWFDLLAHPSQWHLSASYLETASEDALVSIGKLVSLEHRRHLIEPTLLGLQEMLTYGLRGLTAYTHHAEVLGRRVPDADFVAEAYAFLCSKEANDANNVLGMILKCGEVNLTTMQALSEGHSGKFGVPEPSPVKLTPTPGKCILISGHDMQDLHDLLVQTEGTGINVYTHGEMLPAHGYPELKKFSHLVGNYGGAWYRQQKEFAKWPGSILMTSNCVIEPRDYSPNLFTTGEVGWPGVTHIPYAKGGIGSNHPKDYSAVIARALELPGFTEADVPAEEKTVLTGFGHNAILNVAGEVVDAIKTGKLSHIFLMGGCDGSEPDRKYFTKAADATPDDTMILTLGCGKFRFYDHDFGMVPGTQLPRLLDVGQCNDAWSSIVVATKLADVFETDVNGLPLSLDLQWLEQKAVVILLSLLHLGVKNIRIGPKPPAFLTPEALAILVDKFNLQVVNVKDPEGDVHAMMAGH